MENSKTELLNNLFKEWKKVIPEYKDKFISDGIIDEQKYEKTEPKILFIAKEPNDPEQNEWDFRDIWKEKLSGTFSYRLEEWSFGILENFPPFDHVWENYESSQRQNYIQNVAFMNIKKSGGLGISEYDEMLKYLDDKNLNYIHKEIDIISPDTIILGTSWEPLRNKLFPNLEWLSSGYGIKIARHNNSKVIDFYHPSSRTPAAAAYSLLQNIVQSEKFNNL